MSSIHVILCWQFLFGRNTNTFSEETLHSLYPFVYQVMHAHDIWMFGSIIGLYAHTICMSGQQEINILKVLSSTALWLNHTNLDIQSYHLAWYRYDVICNRWTMETAVPKRASDDSSVGFIALDGELHLLTLLNIYDSTTDIRRSRQHKRSATLLIQIYHPVTRRWRSLIAKPPFPPLDFKTAVMCTIRL